MCRKKTTIEKSDSPEKYFDIEYTLWEKLILPFQRMWYGIKEQAEYRRYRKQRAHRGYSDYDILDIQMWFVHTMRPRLENIIENLYSYPDGITEEEWKSILQEMVHLLQIMDVDDDCFVRKHLGLALKENNAEITLRIDQERVIARNKFFNLFDKWYWDLRY